MKNKYAFISDIHGNSFALEAVLSDIKERGIQAVYNLGDSLFGPLDPHGTFRLLCNNNIKSLSGNGDRELLAADDGSGGTMNQLRKNLTEDERNWLSALLFLIETDDIFMCHASPDSDEEYLLEEVGGASVALKNSEAIKAKLATVSCPVVVCGHSHLPHIIKLPDGPLVINAGSVGLPAYADDLPVLHKMESVSPHAKYVSLEKYGNDWRCEIVHVPYDWEAAAALALAQNRPDWAGYLKTGFAGRLVA